MKKNTLPIQIIVTCLCLASINLFGQVNCYECSGNTATGHKSMASGYNNFVYGDYSTALGRDITIHGDYSFVTGYQSVCNHNFSGIYGSFDTTTHFHSFILGSLSKTTGTNSIVVGNNSKSLADFALSLGYHLQTKASEAITIGVGLVDNPLINRTSNSLMVGFRSNLPTLYVGPSDGVGTTGKVGIGTSSPGEALEVVGIIKTDGLVERSLNKVYFCVK